MRSVPEWRGKSDDDGIPGRVMVRIFERFEGKCQCGCGRRIFPGEGWHVDHIIALCNGGEHREKNLQPLLTEHHKAKTREDLAIKAKGYRQRKRHLGIKSRRRSSFRTNRDGPWKQKMDGTVVRRNGG